MQKRGLADVDWIIASGVFLVSLVTVLIFIKPGIIPLHSSDSLLNLIEDNFKKDLIADGGKLAGGVYWTVYQTPIFLKKGDLSGENCIKLDFPYNLDADRMRIYNDTGRLDTDAVPFQIISGSPNKLIFKAKLNSQGDDKNIYYIYSSDNLLYTSLNNNLVETLDCPGGISYQNETANPSGPNTIHFVYEYGVTENSKGIARPIVDLTVENINGLTGLSIYNKLKDIYGYPKLKEFALSFKNKEDNNVDCSFNPQEGDTKLNCDFQPINPGDANVYTQSWSDFVLDYNGERYPVTISIKVW